jgi:hypothetical protein
MLTKRKIKKFCIYSIGVFVENPEKNIEVTKCKHRRHCYQLNILNKRAPAHLLKNAWEYHATGTEFENVFLDII